MDYRFAYGKSNEQFRDSTYLKSKENVNINFQKRGGKVDWKKVAAIDVDIVHCEYDIHALQDNIENFVFCCIENEIDVKTVNPIFIKLFKIGQFISEYLLHTQDHLINVINKMKSDKAEQNFLKDKREEHKGNESSKQRPQGNKKGDQKNIMLEHISSYNCCTYCFKIFENSKFLVRHIYRRHPEDCLAGLKMFNVEVNSYKTEDAQNHKKNVQDYIKQEIIALKLTLEKSMQEIKDYVQLVGNARLIDKICESNHAHSVKYCNEAVRKEKEISKNDSDFYEQLQELKLKYSNSEDMIQSLEGKYIALMQSSNDEILQKVQTYSETMRSEKVEFYEKLEEHMLDFSKFKSELEHRLVILQNSFFEKLNNHCKEWENRFFSQKCELNAEIQKIYTCIEANPQNLNSSQSVADLEKRLEHHLQILLARPRRKSHQKSGDQSNIKPVNKALRDVHVKTYPESVRSIYSGNQTVEMIKDIKAIGKKKNPHVQTSVSHTVQKVNEPYSKVKGNHTANIKLAAEEINMTTNSHIQIYQESKMEDSGDRLDMSEKSSEGALKLQDNQDYHVVSRLKRALEISPGLLDGLYKELLGLVDDKLESFGIDSLQTSLDFSNFHEKFILIDKEKEYLKKKYNDYNVIRDYYDALCEQKTQLLSQPSGRLKRISFAEPEVTERVEPKSSSESEQDSHSSQESNFHVLPIHSENRESSGFIIENEITHDSSNLFTPRPLPRKSLLEIKSQSSMPSSHVQPMKFDSHILTMEPPQLNFGLTHSFVQNEGITGLTQKKQDLEKYDFLEEDESSSSLSSIKSLSTWDGDGPSTESIQ